MRSGLGQTTKNIEQFGFKINFKGYQHLSLRVLLCLNIAFVTLATKILENGYFVHFHFINQVIVFSTFSTDHALDTQTSKSMKWPHVWKYVKKKDGDTFLTNLTLVPNPHNSNLELRLKLFGLPTWLGTKPTCEKRSTIMIHASEVSLKIRL